MSKQNYMLLDRCRSDCEYFLGNGCGEEKFLWAGNVEKQIAKMRELHELVPEKPEWLSWEEIGEYEEKMLILRACKNQERSAEREETYLSLRSLCAKLARTIYMMVWETQDHDASAPITEEVIVKREWYMKGYLNALETAHLLREGVAPNLLVLFRDRGVFQFKAGSAPAHPVYLTEDMQKWLIEHPALMRVTFGVYE